MKIIIFNSLQVEKSQYIAWACFRNVIWSKYHYIGFVVVGLKSRFGGGGGGGGGGGRTGLVVRASDSGSGDPGSILGRVGVLFP